MEEVKMVVMDNGRLMAQFDDGTLAPLRLYNTIWTVPRRGNREACSLANGVYVDYYPSKKETNFA